MKERIDKMVYDEKANDKIAFDERQIDKMVLDEKVIWQNGIWWKGKLM